MNTELRELPPILEVESYRDGRPYLDCPPESEFDARIDVWYRRWIIDEYGGDERFSFAGIRQRFRTWKAQVDLLAVALERPDEPGALEMFARTWTLRAVLDEELETPIALLANVIACEGNNPNREERRQERVREEEERQRLRREHEEREERDWLGAQSVSEASPKQPSQREQRSNSRLTEANLGCIVNPKWAEFGLEKLKRYQRYHPFRTERHRQDVLRQLDGVDPLSPFILEMMWLVQDVAAQRTMRKDALRFFSEIEHAASRAEDLLPHYDPRNVDMNYLFKESLTKLRELRQHARTQLKQIDLVAPVSAKGGNPRDLSKVIAFNSAVAHVLSIEILESLIAFFSAGASRFTAPALNAKRLAALFCYFRVDGWRSENLASLSNAMQTSLRRWLQNRPKSTGSVR